MPPPDNTPLASPPYPAQCIAALSRRPGTSCSLIAPCPPSASRVCRAGHRAASAPCLPQSVGSCLLTGALSTRTTACRLCRNCTTGRHGSRCRECPGHRRIAAGCALWSADHLLRSRCTRQAFRAPAAIPGLSMTR